MRISYEQADSNGLAEFLCGYPEDIAYANLPDNLITIDNAEFEDIVNNRNYRRYDTVNKKIVEYTPPEPEQQVITPQADQSTADMWEAILAISARQDALEGK